MAQTHDNNSCKIIGRIKAIDVRELDDGKKVATVQIEVTEQWQGDYDAQWRESKAIIPVEVWNKHIEQVQKLKNDNAIVEFLTYARANSYKTEKGIRWNVWLVVYDLSRFARFRANDADAAEALGEEVLEQSKRRRNNK